MFNFLLPVKGCPLPPDQFQVPSHMSEKSMHDMPYNMSTKGGGGGMLDMSGFGMPGPKGVEGFGMPMDLHRRDFASPGKTYYTIGIIAGNGNS
jgi:hypothetical protein